MNGPFTVYQISFTLRALLKQLEWSFIIFVRDTVQKKVIKSDIVQLNYVISYASWHTSWEILKAGSLSDKM